ncbi:hypothetical protein ECANGB1_1009 [Enterospora canceri]|uniref:Uncharacterized protein n=1 Tax=Enterospora canceri TaxID=1081671 RepID=A0A1Y1S708_9MICR|nr:hypothetical protein ECANGB1_1009 [Enterospora canceri]
MVSQGKQMNRDVIVLLLGTLKVCVFIGLAIGYANKDSKHRDYAIPVVGALAFAWVSWAVTYIAQIHPFVQPEITKNAP